MLNSRITFCNGLFQFGQKIAIGIIFSFGLFGLSFLGAAEFIVTSTADDASPGTLRSAMTAANLSAGPHTIRFAIPGTGPFVIQPTTMLPPITQSVLIDGYSQPGSQLNTAAFGDYNGAILVEINGNQCLVAEELAAVGFDLAAGSDDSRIQGFSFTQWRDAAIQVESVNVTVSGNLFGIGLAPSAESKANACAIVVHPIVEFESRAVIGGTLNSDRNVIVGSSPAYFGEGALIIADSDDLTIQGNLIGTNLQGTASFTSPPTDTLTGIQLFETDRVLILKNVISGCSQVGVQIQSAASNTIQGNWIGTDYSGTKRIPNLGTGVELYDSGTYRCRLNLITENVIAGNGDLQQPYSLNGNGIAIGTEDSQFRLMDNVISHNQIGGAGVENSGNGIFLLLAGNTKIESNIISGNRESGIFLYLAEDSNIIKNIIGLNQAQTAALPNKNGILLGQSGAEFATGGNVIGKGNVIAGNSHAGIFIIDVTGTSVSSETTFGKNNLSPSTIFPNAQGDIIATEKSIFYIDHASD